MTQFPHYAQKYRAKDNRLYKTMAGKNGTFERLPCNFVPRITAEITPDGGAETTTSIRLRGIRESGRPLPKIEIPAAELAGFNWLTQRWGMDCIPEVGKALKDCVRHAIQTTAAGAEKKTVYAVTGWKEVMEEQRMTSLALLHKCKQQSFQKFFALISWTACGFAVLLCKVFFQVNMGHHFIESIYRIIYFNNSFQFTGNFSWIGV